MINTAALQLTTDLAPEVSSHDRLGFTFCLALALHAALILGVSFNREDHSTNALKLDITLAQHRSQKAPEEADFLAQNNQEGSGTLEEIAMLTTREMASFQDNIIQETTQQKQIRRSNQQIDQKSIITSTNQNTRKENLLQDIKEKPLSEQQGSDTVMIDRQMEIASLEAKLDIQQYAYAKRPRIRRLTSLSTKQADDALYLHNWRTKIEMIGNQHYPDKARSKNIYGDLRLVVSLLPNGDVQKVKVLKSSGHHILDQAAIRIVHLAAPYDNFPQAMRQQVDVLEIIRTWRFHQGTLTSS